ncbi:hypothetical protein DX933_06255 [Ornithinibacillus gellani]|nr:hypothetical protein DX933_06255 [Ornithinibacillus gellani]
MSIIFVLITGIISGGSTASKGLIGSTKNQWGECKPPLIEVSLYHFEILLRSNTITNEEA